MNINEQEFLREVERLVGFRLSPEQSGLALDVLSEVKAEASFDMAEADERAEMEEIRSNYRELRKRSGRVVNG